MGTRIRIGGGALLLAWALAGCGGQPAQLAPVPAATPTPAVLAPVASWAQALTFSGDVQGGMDHVLPASDAARSECSGRSSLTAGAWASALYGPVGGDVYEVLVTVRPYRGPSTYRAPDVSVQVARPDGSAVWRTSPGDAATFGVGLDEESGTLSATLTNLSTAATKLRLDGRWSCRT
jgi:hypothetical protein